MARPIVGVGTVGVAFLEVAGVFPFDFARRRLRDRGRARRGVEHRGVAPNGRRCRTRGNPVPAGRQHSGGWLARGDALSRARRDAGEHGLDRGELVNQGCRPRLRRARPRRLRRPRDPRRAPRDGGPARGSIPPGQTSRTRRSARWESLSAVELCCAQPWRGSRSKQSSRRPPGPTSTARFFPHELAEDRCHRKFLQLVRTWDPTVYVLQDAIRSQNTPAVQAFAAQRSPSRRSQA